MIKRLLFIAFGIMMFGSGMMAQDVIRLGITKTDVSQFALKTSLWESLLMVDLTQPNALTTISDKLVSAYTNDPGFKVIDYRSYDLVADERERQKGEEFIDGYIVEQGKSEGVNFILSPIFVAPDDHVACKKKRFDVIKKRQIKTTDNGKNDNDCHCDDNWAYRIVCKTRKHQGERGNHTQTQKSNDKSPIKSPQNITTL